jgi:hypothetical protein
VTLALRLAVAAAASAVAVLAAGWQPASLAIIARPLTWLIRTGRTDLGLAAADRHPAIPRERTRIKRP